MEGYINNLFQQIKRENYDSKLNDYIKINSKRQNGQPIDIRRGRGTDPTDTFGEIITCLDAATQVNGLDDHISHPIRQSVVALTENIEKINSECCLKSFNNDVARYVLAELGSTQDIVKDIEQLIAIIVKKFDKDSLLVKSVNHLCKLVENIGLMYEQHTNGLAIWCSECGADHKTVCDYSEERSIEVHYCKCHHGKLHKLRVEENIKFSATIAIFLYGLYMNTNYDEFTYAFMFILSYIGIVQQLLAQRSGMGWDEWRKDNLMHRMWQLLISQVTCGLAYQGTLQQRMVSIPLAYQWRALVINLMVYPRMCSNTKCVCSSEAYGQHLSKLRDNIYHNIYQRSIDNNGSRLWAKYDESNVAVSHCWGDELLVSSAEENFRISNCIKDTFCQPAWLDIAQTEPFDPKRCRKQYENNVVIVAKPLASFKFIIPISQLEIQAILALSDWGERGWISQEVTSATDLYVLVGERIIKLDKLEEWVKNLLGMLNGNMVDDYVRLTTARTWRNKLDCITSAQWWCRDVQTLMKYIYMSVGKTQFCNTSAMNGCWMPLGLVLNEKLERSFTILPSTSDGVCTIDGEIYKIKIHDMLQFKDKLSIKDYTMLLMCMSYYGAALIYKLKYEQVEDYCAVAIECWSDTTVHIGADHLIPLTGDVKAIIEPYRIKRLNIGSLPI